MKLTFFLSFSICLVSCQTDANFSSIPQSDDLEMELSLPSPSNSKLIAGNFPPPQQLPAEQTKPSQKKEARKVIKTATISMEVDDYRSARQQLETAIKRYDAYIDKEKEINHPHVIRNNITIRISPQQFDLFIQDIEKLKSTLINKEISAKDITKEFLDLESRLTTKRAVIKRYQELLSKAKSIKEILDVEDHLRMVIEEVEVVEGQLRYYKNQIGLSTIHLSIEQRFEEAQRQRPDFFSKLLGAFSSGWNGFLSLIIGLISIWPLLLMIPVIIWGWKKLFKK